MADRSVTGQLRLALNVELRHLCQYIICRWRSTALGRLGSRNNHRRKHNQEARNCEVHCTLHAYSSRTNLPRNVRPGPLKKSLKRELSTLFCTSRGFKRLNML